MLGNCSRVAARIKAEAFLSKNVSCLLMLNHSLEVVFLLLCCKYGVRTSDLYVHCKRDDFIHV